MEQKILDTFQKILDIPDNVIESVPDSMIQGLVDAIDVKKLIEVQTEELKAANLTIVEVRRLQLDLLDAIEDFKKEANYDQLAPKKQQLIGKMIAALLDSLEIICQNFETFDAKLPTRLIHPKAKLPTYAHEEDDGGADVYAIEDIVIRPNTYGNRIPTGLEIQIPKGWILSPRPRGGLSVNTALRIANSPGTIERGYYEEIFILLDNFSDEVFTIKAGDRIAQLVLERRYWGKYVQVDDFDKETDSRMNIELGRAGFNSTGV